MYGKFFSSTFTGSMYGAGPVVFAVWGYVIANTQDSTVELNPKMLAAAIGASANEVETAIGFLCEPDPKSRNPEMEGRRLVREGQFQFRVVTHQHYRAIRNDDDRKEYNRKKQQESRDRRQSKSKRKSLTVNDSQRVSAQAEAEAETEAEGERPPTPHEPETASEPPKTPHSALTPLISLIGPPRGSGAHAGGNAAQDAAPQTTTPDEIPEGLAPVQYGFYILETLAIPASYGLRVKLGDAIEMLARVETCPMSEATPAHVGQDADSGRPGAVQMELLARGWWLEREPIAGRFHRGMGAMTPAETKQVYEAACNMRRLKPQQEEASEWHKALKSFELKRRAHGDERLVGLDGSRRPRRTQKQVAADNRRTQGKSGRRARQAGERSARAPGHRAV